MSRPHEGRVFVSGGTTGMGLAAAKRLVAGGARGFVVGRDEQKLAAALSALGDEASDSDEIASPSSSVRNAGRHGRRAGRKLRR
jgi:NAD(P)-dependent dehydrogenase (short-subunit alcohol dehydrogenase family)